MVCFILFLICGVIITEIKAKPRIVGGLEVVDRQYFAYQVSVRYGPSKIHICGGSIIDESHVLTASHCVFIGQSIMKPEDLQVVSGDLDISTETNTTVKSDVVEIISHSDYNGKTVQHDITVLKLKEPLRISPLIKPVELANSTPPDETTCIVSGWGFTKVNGRKSQKMRFVEVPIQNMQKCNSAYNNKISEGMLCAGFEEGGKDSCQYDSGGPLVCDGKLSGIISWGYECAKAGYPGVYTDVSKYKSWIMSKTVEEKSTITPRIIGGKLAPNQTDFSYQISLRYQSSHICGGTIIDDKHVLTASHCVTNDGKVVKASLFKVAGGSLSLEDPKFEKKVKYIFTHPGYDSETIQNDVAVLRIEGTFDVSSIVKPIALSTVTPAPNTSCNVSGWGITEKNTLNEKLMYAQVNILNITKCSINYDNRLRTGMICAGYWEGKHDACQGDSGGPLVCNNKIAGIVSWGFNCALEGYPGVYTDVPVYTAWIKKQIQRSSSTNLLANTMLIFIITCFVSSLNI